MADEEATAYHEAGDAVVGAVCGSLPNSVTIIPDESSAGKNEFSDDCPPQFKNYLSVSPEKRAYVETCILIGIGGTVANDLHFPSRAHDAADAYDERYARMIIDQNASWAANDRDSYFQQLQDTARSQLETNWPWVELVASELIERKTIWGAEVMKLRPIE